MGRVGAPGRGMERRAPSFICPDIGAESEQESSHVELAECGRRREAAARIAEANAVSMSNAPSHSMAAVRQPMSPSTTALATAFVVMSLGLHQDAAVGFPESFPDLRTRILNERERGRSYSPWYFCHKLRYTVDLSVQLGAKRAVGISGSKCSLSDISLWLRSGTRFPEKALPPYELTGSINGYRKKRDASK